MDHTETSHARRRKAPERERRQPLLTTSSMHEDPLAAPKRARSPPVGRKWRATLDEESIVDEILIKEIHERTIRDEARGTAHGGSQGSKRRHRGGARASGR